MARSFRCCAKERKGRERKEKRRGERSGIIQCPTHLFKWQSFLERYHYDDTLASVGEDT